MVLCSALTLISGALILRSTSLPLPSRSEGVSEWNIESLRVMGRGLVVAGCSSAAVVAAGAVPSGTIQLAAGPLAAGPLAVGPWS